MELVQNLNARKMGLGSHQYLPNIASNFHFAKVHSIKEPYSLVFIHFIPFENDSFMTFLHLLFDRKIVHSS